MNQERSGSERGLGPQNKERLVMSSPETPPALIVHVSKKDVVVQEVAENGLELKCALGNGYYL